MTIGLPLTGKTIVITRPERQSGTLYERLSKLGAHVIKFPLIAIEAPENSDFFNDQLNSLDGYDCLIFTSRNAVEMTFETLAKSSPTAVSLGLLESLQIAAVGKQTAEALENHGVTVSIVPDVYFNSEALLEHDSLRKVASQRLAIIKGEGGRDLLRDTLLKRGAEVDYIDAYRRICPMTNLLPLVKCQESDGIDIIALTSVEGLSNLFTLGSGQTWLSNTTLLVGSQRMANSLSNIDHTGSVIVADDPSDDQMINSLLNWANNS